MRNQPANVLSKRTSRVPSLSRMRNVSSEGFVILAGYG